MTHLPLLLSFTRHDKNPPRSISLTSVPNSSPSRLLSQQLLPPTIRNNPPLPHHQHALHLRHDIRHLVRNQDDCRPLLRQRPHQLAKLPLRKQIQRIRRLIQQQAPCRSDQRPSQSESVAAAPKTFRHTHARAAPKPQPASSIASARSRISVCVSTRFGHKVELEKYPVSTASNPVTFRNGFPGRSF